MADYDERGHKNVQDGDKLREVVSLHVPFGIGGDDQLGLGAFVLIHLLLNEVPLFQAILGVVVHVPQHLYRDPTPGQLLPVLLGLVDFLLCFVP